MAAAQTTTVDRYGRRGQATEVRVDPVPGLEDGFAAHTADALSPAEQRRYRVASAAEIERVIRSLAARGNMAGHRDRCGRWPGGWRQTPTSR